MRTYLCGAVKAFLEHNANTPERRHHLPAGSQLARSRDAVTLALDLHVVKDGLVGAGRVSGATDEKNSAKGRPQPTFRPDSLLWRFMSGRPADRPLARSGSSTNV